MWKPFLASLLLKKQKQATKPTGYLACRAPSLAYKIGIINVLGLSEINDA